MEHFFKDGNVKFSQHSQFLQIVDLIAYAAFLKCKAEAKALTPWQENLGLGDVYDSLPREILNRRAARNDPTLGIVRL